MSYIVDPVSFDPISFGHMSSSSLNENFRRCEMDYEPLRKKVSYLSTKAFIAKLIDRLLMSTWYIVPSLMKSMSTVCNISEGM